MCLYVTGWHQNAVSWWCVTAEHAQSPVKFMYMIKLYFRVPVIFKIIRPKLEVFCLNQPLNSSLAICNVYIWPLFPSGKKYGVLDYLSCVCMSVGLILFTLADSSVSPSFNTYGEYIHSIGMYGWQQPLSHFMSSYINLNHNMASKTWENFNLTSKQVSIEFVPWSAYRQVLFWSPWRWPLTPS